MPGFREWNKVTAAKVVISPGYRKVVGCMFTVKSAKIILVLQKCEVISDANQLDF